MVPESGAGTDPASVEGNAEGVEAGSPDSSNPPARGPVSRLVRNKRFVKLVGVLITLALVYYAFFVVLPSEISWAEVQAALRGTDRTGDRGPAPGRPGADGPPRAGRPRRPCPG